MRNYYQAALAVTAVISVISLLFYRHEYNKLRYVLEVFNYFGKPNQKSIVSNCSNDIPIFEKFNIQLEEPFSSWQRIDDDLYVYSAYNIYESEVKVVGFGSFRTINSTRCAMFFKGEMQSVLGRLKYTLINHTITANNSNKLSEYGAYHFTCTHTKKATPIGITFLTNHNANIDHAPILSVKVQPQSLTNSNTVVCVTPPIRKQITPTDRISFINFHDQIGMNNFVVYDAGVPNSINSRLREVSMTQSPYWKFTYTVIPWNFPFYNVDYNIMRSIIEADCLYRSYNKAMYVAVLSWEEYIVMKYHHSIVDLIVDFKKSRLRADRYRLKTLTFCTQQPDDTKHLNSSLTIFKKTHYYPSIDDKYPVHILLPHNILSKGNTYTYNIGNDLVALNQYKHCTDMTDLTKGKQDSTILRFMEDVQNSPVFKKFLGRNTFS